MRTLVVTPMLPPQSESERGGKHRRAVVFLRALAGLSSAIEMLYIVPERLMQLAEDPRRLSRSQSDFWGLDVTASLAPRAVRRETAWRHYGAGIFDAAAQPALHPYGGSALGRSLRHRFEQGVDCVFADRLDAALPVLAASSASARRPATTLFDIDDVNHKVLLRELGNSRWRPGKLALALHLPALLAAERRAVSQSALSFVCSDVDAAHLRRLGFGAVHVVPNAITPPERPPGVVSQPTVLFLGAQHHPPNRAAAARLAVKIWPLVRRQVPDARLLLAGAGSETLRLPGDDQGVECLGFVGDLDSLYARSRAVCCPIAHGSGTRLKLLEAAAYARPMVSTAVGAEGLAFRDGQDILLRESDAELAQACVELLTDDALCLRLGAAGRRAMQSRYDARAVERSVAEMIASGERRCRL